MDQSAGYAGLQTIYQLTPNRRLMPNHLHPPSDRIQNTQDDQEPGRDSLGSDCVPGMVEDHGSEISADECDYRGIELWGSFWESRMNNMISRTSPYPALQGSPATARKARPGQDFRTDGGIQLHMLHQAHTTKDQRSQSLMPLFGATAERQRSKARNPPPRASYSIFPPPSPPGPRTSSFSRPRTGSIATSPHAFQSPLDTKTPSIWPRDAAPPVDTTIFYPATSKQTRATPKATIRTVTSTHGSPLIPFPSLSTEPLRPPSRLKPLPDLPVQARTASRRPSLAALRKLSLSKLATNSSPSLASIAQTQAKQTALVSGERDQHPLRRPALLDRSLRPLPPLPVEETATTPPVVSVFEFDSDTESVRGDGSTGGFARRLIRGITHPLRKDKASHQRSVSDGRASAASSRIPRGRGSRAETIGAEQHVGFDTVRGEDGGGEDISGNRRQGSEMFGRILGRWSA